MKVYEILKLVCDFTDNCSIAEKLESLAGTDTNLQSIFSQEEQDFVKMLTDCYCLIEDEIASAYLPLLRQEICKPKDFKLNYVDFEKRPLEIYSVKDRYGRNVRYKKFPTYILIFASQATITYSYVPDKLAFDDEVQINLPARVLAYGTTREYYLRQGFYDEADVWEGRFKDALKIFSRKKGEIMIPKRWWL